MTYTYKYPRPALTVDCVIFSADTGNREVVLIQRENYPFEGMWALPGGFVDMDETVEEAAARELKEETGLSGMDLEQLHTFSAIDRDPRGRTISVVFYGFADKDEKSIVAGSDARNVKWFNIDNLPELGFDHNEIIDLALNNCFK